MENQFLIVRIPAGIYKISAKCPECERLRYSAYLCTGRPFKHGNTPAYCEQWFCECGHIDFYDKIELYGKQMPPGTLTTAELIEINKEGG